MDLFSPSNMPVASSPISFLFPFSTSSHDFHGPKPEEGADSEQAEKKEWMKQVQKCWNTGGAVGGATV
jgi:hypothetical protein